MLPNVFLVLMDWLLEFPVAKLKKYKYKSIYIIKIRERANDETIGTPTTYIGK